MMHTVVIGITSILLYLVSAVLLGVRLRNRDTSPVSKWKGLLPAIFAALLHGWLLIQALFLDQGLNLGLFNALSLLTWIISAIIVTAAIARPTETLGIAAFPGAALAITLESMFAAERITSISSTPLEIHIIISVAAYAVLSIAAVQAILLTVQDNQLRNKRLGGFVRALPPLQTMENMLFQMIGIGFILQSLSLLTGFIFLEDMMAQHLVHKTVLSLIAWLFFGILLWGRWQFGWRGRKAIRLTLAGFIALVMSYVGSKFVLELIIQQPQ